jgi:hypothetical protein
MEYRKHELKKSERFEKCLPLKSRMKENGKGYLATFSSVVKLPEKELVSVSVPNQGTKTHTLAFHCRIPAIYINMNHTIYNISLIASFKYTISTIQNCLSFA